MNSNARPRKLFNREVYQSPCFIARRQDLGEIIVDQILAVTARYYPRFTTLSNGLVLGQLSEDLPPGHPGPNLQFIYTVLKHKVFFIDLRINGFTQAEITAIEDCYNL